MDLFEQALSQHNPDAPLADRMRPEELDQVLGQAHLLEQGKFLRSAIEEDRLPSLIFWGPPGTGKTTLAMVIAHHTGAHFQSYSAVTSGIKELKEVMEKAKTLLAYQHQKTILFIDEIHRFNKAQQDAFLPYVEQGIVTLIGATTENPSFEVNAALLSRCQVMVLKALDQDALVALMQRALADEKRGLKSMELVFDDKALRLIADKAYGDARAALNQLELAANFCARTSQSKEIHVDAVEEALQEKALLYDKGGEEHYNLISALHKSVRGSDPDAALYWLGRMLEAGEDPHYLLRRMARMASEDIGLADPNALHMAVSARQAFDFIGLPEGKLALAELVVYLSLAPKSNTLELGYNAVQKAIKQQGPLPVPMHIRNAPTGLMRNLGYGKDYHYAHDYEGHWVPDDYLPDNIIDQRFFRPGTLGWEGKMKPLIEQRLEKRAEARKFNPPKPPKPE
jgi:putative ATPase